MNKTMKAALYYGPEDIRVEELPLPPIGRDEVLLKTLACGLCGGETMAWRKKDTPWVLGHEPVGEVVARGDDVSDYDIGDRLFINHHVGRINSHLSRRGHFTRDQIGRAHV